jgi:hypothetical protein
MPPSTTDRATPAGTPVHDASGYRVRPQGPLRGGWDGVAEGGAPFERVGEGVTLVEGCGFAERLGDAKPLPDGDGWER